MLAESVNDYILSGISEGCSCGGWNSLLLLQIENQSTKIQNSWIINASEVLEKLKSSQSKFQNSMSYSSE